MPILCDILKDCVHDLVVLFINVVPMGFNHENKKKYWVLMPLAGVGLFMVLYVLAAVTYPGGSNFDENQIGFKMGSNYLCDLLDTNTPNGLPNPSRVYSRLALLILCSSLILLWYELPRLFQYKGTNVLLMRAAGITSMALTLFLAAGNHDVVVRVAGAFGVVALVTTFIELIKTKHYMLFGFGIWCLMIFFLNYYIYETGVLLTMLPTIQKITFLSFILWFSFLNIQLYRATKAQTT